MKTKTEAAKTLLDAGWTLEEVIAVLEVQQPAPHPFPVQPLMPPPWQPLGPWWGGGSIRINPLNQPQILC